MICTLTSGMAQDPEVAYKVQENVKKSIESMTDLKVTQVNIHIQECPTRVSEPVLTREQKEVVLCALPTG